MRSLPESADRTTLRRLLRRAVVRTRWMRATAWAAAGLVAVAILAAAGFVPETHLQSALVAVTVALLAAAAALLTSPSMQSVAGSLEKRTPESRNLLLTGFEIADGRTRAAPYIEAQVLGDACALAGRINLTQLMPARRHILSLLVAVVVVIFAVASRPLQSLGAGSGTGSSAPSVRTVTITVTPPSYTGRPAQALKDVVRIDAMAGSRLDISVTADADSLVLTTVGGAQPFTGSGVFAATVIADADGFIGIEPRSATGIAGVRKLIGLSVTPDRPPAVRITAPGKDLLVPNSRRTLSVALEADDELGLASLRLTFTRISGSGENFTFTTGEVPLTVNRPSERLWAATATWALDALKLEPGDMVVYRGLATDRRPGAVASESDSFFVEIASPGALPGEGFAIDDRQDKYAISQQMVIVKTERLLAARSSIPAADFQERVLDLAAEQRQVRAEFVFMMGGELSDAGLDLTTLNEEVEAAGEEDLAAGRLANQGRIDLLRAIRSMSRAAARLADADATAALPLEKDALSYLQRAFSRSRYILRTLGVRERLDTSRRLSGLLTALARDARPSEKTEPRPHVAAARAALAELGALAGESSRTGRPDPTRSAALAQRVLSIDPASPTLRDVATAVTAAEFDRAAAGLATFVRRDLPDQPTVADSPELSALAGAFADALRRERSPR